MNLITADPDRMADTIGYIKTSVRPAVERMDGSLGLSRYANVVECFGATVVPRLRHQLAQALGQLRATGIRPDPGALDPPAVPDSVGVADAAVAGLDSRS